jgi:excisionase family DNA binding protein
MPEPEANPMLHRLDEIAGLLRQLVSAERPKPRRLLRLAEAAQYLHVSTGTLRAIVQRGELPVIRTGSNGDGHVPWLIDRADLDGWIEKSKVTIE